MTLVQNRPAVSTHRLPAVASWVRAPEAVMQSRLPSLQTCTSLPVSTCFLDALNNCTAVAASSTATLA
ncbi:hypothetical protein VZT92_005941 [Zoarces viviparus]|uniref:Uncharacterized protein n=1 Tax=Zoarces viviparus TaxID=48416 RepID=A0AAW1FMR8_ZOAVI